MATNYSPRGRFAVSWSENLYYFYFCWGFLLRVIGTSVIDSRVSTKKTNATITRTPPTMSYCCWWWLWIAEHERKMWSTGRKSRSSSRSTVDKRSVGYRINALKSDILAIWWVSDHWGYDLINFLMDLWGRPCSYSMCKADIPSGTFVAFYVVVRCTFWDEVKKVEEQWFGLGWNWMCGQYGNRKYTYRFIGDRMVEEREASRVGLLWYSIAVMESVLCVSLWLTNPPSFLLSTPHWLFLWMNVQFGIGGVIGCFTVCIYCRVHFNWTVVQMVICLTICVVVDQNIVLLTYPNVVEAIGERAATRLKRPTQLCYFKGHGGLFGPSKWSAVH